MLGMMFSRPTWSRKRGRCSSFDGCSMAPQSRSVRPDSVQALGECLDGVNAGGVDGRHIAQAQNDDRLKGFDVGGGLDQLLGGAEEERAVNAQQRDVGRNDAALQRCAAGRRECSRR